MAGVMQELARDVGALRVWLWDIGPSKAIPPKRPEVPKGQRDTAEYDLAMIEFQEIKDKYEADLKAYKKAREDYAKWQTDNGGAIETEWWKCDADDALERDPNRYWVSSRTRGLSHLPNRGLPAGVKQGHGQAEIERRRREGEEDLEQALRKDPVFGEQELRR
jgi:hypothetical protein